MESKLKKKKTYGVILTFMILLLLALTIMAIGLGRYFISPIDVIKIIFSKILDIPQTWEKQAEGVVFTLRLPRILAALLVGAALSLSGASYQGVFKNPLVAPDMLGVSAGACVGASWAILFQSNQLVIQIAAFGGGIIAVMAATAIPRFIRNNSMMTLVLAGVIVGGLMNSVLGLLKYLADPDTQLASITHWQLGSLSSIVWRDIIYAGPAIIVSMLVLLLIRWRINILSLGEDEAKTLGTNIKKSRGLVIFCATVLTASAVCISGTIGWIGLVIPHFGRMLVGPDNRKLLPVSAVLGAIFLLLIDTLARNLTSAELPLSILTGLIGAPFYFYLLLKQRMKLS
ncbi:FecCD family ABC transporter permease [Robinsoniella peoriensis]|uniref:FecCD family ABC transporter permease n=1 Tax=Robinsoniella peoriensis TaxID=180332 RepID=UPI00085C2C06|nr:iron ABC transporter permease [Robinsoniella peoriensis]